MEFKKGERVLFIGEPRTEGSNIRYKIRLSNDKIYIVSKGNYNHPDSKFGAVLELEGFEPCCWYVYTFKKVDDNLAYEIESLILQEHLMESL